MNLYIRKIELGPLLPFTDFLAILTPHHLPRIQQEALPHYQKVMKQYIDEQMDEEYVAGILKDVNEYAGKIESTDSISDIRAFLASLVDECMPDKECGVTHVFGGYHEGQFGEVDFNYWPELMLLQAIGGCVLPIPPLQLRVFRSTGWSSAHFDCDVDDFPFDVPLLEFKFSECFEIRANERCQALSEMLSTEMPSPFFGSCS